MTDLRQKLAAIEHVRWADWQYYLHSKLMPTIDGMVMSPEDYQHKHNTIVLLRIEHVKSELAN